MSYFFPFAERKVEKAQHRDALGVESGIIARQNFFRQIEGQGIVAHALASAAALAESISSWMNVEVSCALKKSEYAIISAASIASAISHQFLLNRPNQRFPIVPSLPPKRRATASAAAGITVPLA